MEVGVRATAATDKILRVLSLIFLMRANAFIPCTQAGIYIQINLHCFYYSLHVGQKHTNSRNLNDSLFLV